MGSPNSPKTLLSCHTIGRFGGLGRPRPNRGPNCMHSSSPISSCSRLNLRLGGAFRADMHAGSSHAGRHLPSAAHTQKLHCACGLIRSSCFGAFRRYTRGVHPPSRPSCSCEFASLTSSSAPVMAHMACLPLHLNPFCAMVNTGFLVCMQANCHPEPRRVHHLNSHRDPQGAPHRLLRGRPAGRRYPRVSAFSVASQGSTLVSTLMHVRDHRRS